LSIFEIIIPIYTIS